MAPHLREVPYAIPASGFRPWQFMTSACFGIPERQLNCGAPADPSKPQTRVQGCLEGPAASWDQPLKAEGMNNRMI